MTADTVLDIRDVEGEPFGDIVAALQELDEVTTLELVNSFEPKPLFYEFRAEVEVFDADGYNCERRGREEFVATLPKQ